MKRSPLLIAVAIAAVCFVSCKNGSTGLPIPKDAAMVLHINTSSITSKLSWNDIKGTNWFKEASADEKDSLSKALMENPEASGVDIKSDFAYFMKKRGNGGFMVFEGNLKDADAFEKVVLNKHADRKVEKDGDLSYVKSEKDNVVCWTKTKFFLVQDAPMFSMMSPYGAGSDNREPASFPVDSLRKFAKELLSLNSDNAIEKDDRFSSLIKESGDVHFWINSEEYMSSMGGGMFSMLKMGSLLQGAVSTFTLNFDNGKITMNTKQYYGKEMQKVMEQYGSRNVDAALINRIPSGDVVGALAVNVDPQFIKGMLKASGVDGMANGFLGRSGLTLDDIINATKGQFLMAVSDLTISKKQVTDPPYYEGGQPNTYTKTEPDMNFLFATSVNNRQSFDKLLGMARQALAGQDSSKYSLQMNNDWFAASNHAQTAQQFLAGGNNNVPFADKISGHPFGLYVDIQKILKASFADVNDAKDSAMYNANTKMWQDLVMTGGEYKNGTATAQMVLNLVDKSTNSLKQINQFAESMHAAKKLSRKDEVMNMPMTDSTTMVPPVVEAPKDNK